MSALSVIEIKSDYLFDVLNNKGIASSWRLRRIRKKVMITIGKCRALNALSGPEQAGKPKITRFVPERALFRDPDIFRAV
jgi:hypothetical protein